MTDFSSITGGGVVSVQSGNVVARRSGAGTDAWDKSYLDVTLSEAVNTTRPIAVTFDGVFSSNTLGGYTNASTATARLLDSTTVRIESPYSSTSYYFSGTWMVIEYA